MGIPARDRKSKAGGDSQSVCAPYPPLGAHQRLSSLKVAVGRGLSD